MKYILGVDPGLSGAVAVYDPKAKALLDVYDMPHLEDRSGRVNIDVTALSMWLDLWAKRIKFAVIEEVGARPGQGVTGMFRFGYATGLVTGMIGSYMIPVHKTPPAVWKMLMNLSSDKDQSRALARDKFPTKAYLFSRKKDADRAEAALLAVFGERLLIEKPPKAVG